MLLLLVLLSLPLAAHGHGRLWHPAGRATMWRMGLNNPVYYQDNELNCGGFARQWGKNGGKCGVCGDPYDGPILFDAGPDNLYANAIITGVYTIGQEFNIQVDLTANHKGWFEFRVCPHNAPSQPVKQSCLDQYVLAMADGSGTRWHLPDDIASMKTIRVRLPPGLSCWQCVLQWRYNTGNNWGCNKKTKKCCMGCGIRQEQFYGCADIAIGTSSEIRSMIPSPNPSNVSQAASVPGVKHRLPKGVISANKRYKYVNKGAKPSAKPRKTFNANQQNQKVNTFGNIDIQSLQQVQLANKGMQQIKRQQVFPKPTSSTNINIYSLASLLTTKKNVVTCEALGTLRDIPGMREWCNDNCRFFPNTCPGHVCKCLNK